MRGGQSWDSNTGLGICGVWLLKPNDRLPPLSSVTICVMEVVGADCARLPGEETEAWQTEIGDILARGRVRARTSPARAASIQYICSGEEKALLGVLWPLSTLALEMQDGEGAVTESGGGHLPPAKMRAAST